MTWIKVEDRLPEKNGYYLVYQEAIEDMFICMWGQNSWYYTNTFITHWMPLPDKPEEYFSI